MMTDLTPAASAGLVLDATCRTRCAHRSIVADAAALTGTADAPRTRAHAFTATAGNQASINCGHLSTGSWAYASTIVETHIAKPAGITIGFMAKDHSQRKRLT